MELQQQLLEIREDVKEAFNLPRMETTFKYATLSVSAIIIL